MAQYQERLARLLAESGSLFFRQGLRLKDGRPTPYFVNLGVFRTGRLAQELGSCFAEWMAEQKLAGKVDVLLGPSYKGSAIAQGAAMSLWRDYGLEVSFDYDRKEPKTHGESSGKGNMFVTGALAPGKKVLIMDDVVTTMATKLELLDKIADQFEDDAPQIIGVSLAVDRQQTQAVYDDQGQVKEGVKGPDPVAAFREKTGLSVWPLLPIRRAVEILYNSGFQVEVDGVRRSLDKELVQRVEEYLAVYGREGAA